MDKKAFLIDMDGVLLYGDQAIPGAKEFIERLREKDYKFLILTNNSRYTPSDLQHRMNDAGIEIEAQHFFSSAMATAHFVSSQKPRGRALFWEEQDYTRLSMKQVILLPITGPILLS